jgi:hypothetical protein
MPYYTESREDTLKEQLRQVSGIPNAAYLVEGEQVFIFAKLVAKVNAYTKAHPGVPVAAFAADLVPDAIASIEEAVNQWHVVPDPYRVRPGQSGSSIVYQKAP